MVEMGVLDKAKQLSGLGGGESDDALPYICLACEAEFEVQHHSCPTCGSFDIRRSKWVTE